MYRTQRNQHEVHINHNCGILTVYMALSHKPVKRSFPAIGSVYLYWLRPGNGSQPSIVTERIGKV